MRNNYLTMKKFCILEQGKYVHDPITIEHKNLFTTDFSDFYRLNWFTKDDPNAFIHEKSITWSEGRSLLYEKVPKLYEYYIFIDDDIKFHGDDIAQTIRDELDENKPLSGTFYRIRHDVWTFNHSLRNMHKKENKRVWPLCLSDLDCMIFHKSFANVIFPIIHHGSGLSLHYAQYICHKLYPRKQIVMARVLVENTRGDPHQDKNLPQFEEGHTLVKKFIKYLKKVPLTEDCHILLQKGLDCDVIKRNTLLYSDIIDKEAITFSIQDLERIYDINNPFFKNRKSLSKQILKICIVITTINAPTSAILKYAKYDCTVIIVGDTKTPHKKYQYLECLGNIVYLGPKEQEKIFPILSDLIPKNHYARKNLGYLYAMINNFDIIYETDDDNIPILRYLDIPTKDGAEVIVSPSIPNIYSLYTTLHIWPRGYPLNLIKESPEIVTESPTETDLPVFVWQSLAEGDPDVDAIYRLTSPDYGNVEQYFNRNLQKKYILNKGIQSPMNSQNTTWINKLAFPFMYIPSTVSFRYCDILRSFVLQRCIWKIGGHLGFTGPTVYQKRNDHNLLNDFESEIPVYQNFDKVNNFIEKTELRGDYMDLYFIYQTFYRGGMISIKELEIVNRWIEIVKTCKL